MSNPCFARPVERDDLEMILQWRNHDQIRRYMINRHPINWSEHQKWFEKLTKNPKYKALIIESPKAPIGFAQFTPTNEEGVVNWGFYAQPSAPKGSGKILGQCALDYAFNILGLRKICGQAFSTNHASILLHQRLGFSREEEFTQYPISGEIPCIMVSFSILQPQWQRATTSRE